ncbi:MAG: hypothetical protein P9X24_09845 [Candidatus Hatepunaea meridiana]|nr:hypothetical protein [Candidatus Hatepunaea meridiana]
MKDLISRLGISVDHLRCLDEVFLEHNEEYARIEDILSSEEFSSFYLEMAQELYAGGKQPRGKMRLSRQMILGDIIEYIFTGRVFYYATRSQENLSRFFKLILYSVNQILMFDSITVNPDIRKLYIDKLENNIKYEILYEKEGDQEVAAVLKESKIKIRSKEWTSEIDQFVDSILPKTLGCPKELIVFAELIRLRKGNIIPLLLIQRIFGDRNPIAPPDFLIVKGNKEFYGIEVGYAKEGQSREFSIRSSVPTFAVDLKNNMHNRCPICGEIILYCDKVIDDYSKGTMHEKLNNEGKYLCKDCDSFNEGRCKYSNYYGRVKSNTFDGVEINQTSMMHYHVNCVRNLTYIYRNKELSIINENKEYFFAQLPEIEGLDNL